MAISTGRLVRVFAKQEAVYNAAETLAVADYVETTECQVSNDPFSLEPSPEKTPGQDLYESFQRRPVSSVRMNALMRGAPSGTTAPEIDQVLAAAMGADAITVSAAAAVTGSGNAGRILMVADDGDGYLRPQVGGSASPLVAFTGSADYKSVNYNLGDDLKSLTLRYQPTAGGAGAGTGPGTPGAPPQLVTGWSPNVTTLTIDGTAEAMWMFDGPAAQVVEGAPAGAAIAGDPAHPTVNPPTGLNAKLWYRVGATGNFVELERAFRTLTISQTAPKMLRNDEAGSPFARGIYIAGQRETTVELSTWAEAGNPLYEAIRLGKAADPRSAPYVAIFAAVGNVEGGRCGVYLPRVRFTLPSGNDGAEGIAWSLTGRAHSNTFADGNSSFAVGVG